MANLRAGTLARKKNGRFQSTAVKSKTGIFLDSRKTKSRVIASMVLNCHVSPRVKVKPRYDPISGRRLLRGRAWFAFCFLLNEVGDLSFFWHKYLTPPLCAVKKIKKFTSEKKVTGKKAIRSYHSWTQIGLLEITHPRNICSQCLFKTCACAIKQTLNYSF